jgi:hypothetical protein
MLATALLRDRHHIAGNLEDDFSIRNMTEMASAQQEGTQTLTTLLASIAAVSASIRKRTSTAGSRFIFEFAGFCCLRDSKRVHYAVFYYMLPEAGIACVGEKHFNHCGAVSKRSDIDLLGRGGARG